VATTYVLLAAAAAALAAIGILYLRLVAARTAVAGEFADIERAEILSPAEAEFLPILEAAIPECRILAQVAMSALVTTRAGVDRTRAFRARGRFDRKRVDFLACTREGQALVVIELDDSSHDSGEARARDVRRDAMLLAAGYPTVRISNRPWPTAAQVRAAVLPAIESVIA
jgi:very-short-patch-repair endonuclease